MFGQLERQSLQLVTPPEVCGEFTHSGSDAGECEAVEVRGDAAVLLIFRALALIWLLRR